MTIPAPYQRFEGEVLPEWIDWNGHMNLAYYVVLFDRATDLLFDELGLGLDYRRIEEKGTFVVETHIRYERELLVGEGEEVRQRFAILRRGCRSSIYARRAKRLRQPAITASRGASCCSRVADQVIAATSPEIETPTTRPITTSVRLS